MNETNSPSLKVVTLQESNFRDPVAALRSIADRIAAGEYGDVSAIAMVINGKELYVSRAGREADAGTVALLLQAGINMMVAPIINRGTLPEL